MAATMKILTSTDRKKLRGLAHHLKPLVMIGQKGLSENVVDATEAALLEHELIKVKFLDFKEDRKNLSAELSKKTESTLVGLVGNTLMLYKQNPQPEKRKIVI